MSIDITPTGQRTLSEEVAEEIRVIMLRRRTTGARLAKELGVSAAWISYRLTGTQPIDLNDLERIASALGVTVVDLLPRARREVTVTYPGSVSEAVDRHPIPHPPIGGRPLNRPADRRPSGGPGRTSRVRPRVGSS